MRIFSFLKGGCIKPIKKHYTNNLTDDLLKGDIILHRATGKFISSLISDFTDSPYSHAEIYIGDGWCVSAEAKGVTFSDKLNTKFVDVLRFKGGLPRDKRGIILEKAYQSLAKPYAFLKLLRFAFYYGPKSVARRAGKVAYICSELTAWCYKLADIDLIPELPEDIEAPADIAKSEVLEWIGAWKDAEEVKDAELNVRHRIQGKHHWLARIVIKLIRPSTIAEYESAIQQRQEGIRQNLIEQSLR
ncbi:MAG: hypothetical protein KAS63_03830 [Candidatus Heimdallarchaeota archaeon]|nr:hypothetical protein [Candidatus Heimdallarchaeota archaeon]MCK4954463.1 hypothetical protein [Candidatus Heimdallarchaeota archaeon]